MTPTARFAEGLFHARAGAVRAGPVHAALWGKRKQTQGKRRKRGRTGRPYRVVVFFSEGGGWGKPEEKLSIGGRKGKGLVKYGRKEKEQMSK